MFYLKKKKRKNRWLIFPISFSLVTRKSAMLQYFNLFFCLKICSFKFPSNLFLNFPPHSLMPRNLLNFYSYKSGVNQWLRANVLFRNILLIVSMYIYYSNTPALLLLLFNYTPV